MGGRVGVWKGMYWGRVFKKECGWVNMLEVCLGGNWICAWDGTWRFPGEILRWILAEQYGGVFGWKIPDGPRIGDLYGPVVGK